MDVVLKAFDAVNAVRSFFLRQDTILQQDSFPSGGHRAVRTRRGTPDAPSGYAPSRVDCPSTRPTIRNASSLSNEETSWREVRDGVSLPAMRELLGRMNITGFDTNEYFDRYSGNTSILPTIGIAISGGGYRAMLLGAGVISAFDSRTADTSSLEHLGGLLQSSTYLSGLSGGSWVIGSLYANNFTTVEAIVKPNQESSSPLWQLDNSIVQGPPQDDKVLSAARYWQDLLDTVTAKADAGFNTSITDYWGRGLSFQLISAVDGGPSYTFSSVSDDAYFKEGNAPLPLIVADERAPGTLIIPTNATLFEFNPWEFGSFDSSLLGFAPLRYVGSNFSDGILPPDQPCVRGFDNFGFVLGTSSSLFNQFFLQINNTQGIPERLKSNIASILGTIGEADNDIADWSPNAFYLYRNATNRNSQSTRLTLVDGGEDLQNIPLEPLLQPDRHVDIIIAVDGSADTSMRWPNGTALVATYQRSLSIPRYRNGTGFPSIPDQNTFLNLGLNSRPSFFGCDSANITGASPLIVYLPNYPYSYYSNTTTFQLSYNDSERDALVSNGYSVATMGNGTRDSQWNSCLGCAILSRSFTRTSTTPPDTCLECFQRYCWDGTINSTAPVSYEPKLFQKSDASQLTHVSLTLILVFISLISFFC